MSEVKEWRPCYICGEKVPWRNLGLGWVQIQYHDCKPVPRAKLEQAERERDEANEACSEKQAIIERMLESERQAVAMLREARKRIARLTNHADPICDECGGDATADGARHRPECVVKRIDAFTAGQPAPVKPVVDDAMVGLALAGYVGGLCNYHGSDDTERIKAGMRAALVAALEGRG